jgi:hypothetical protein
MFGELQGRCVEIWRHSWSLISGWEELRYMTERGEKVMERTRLGTRSGAMVDGAFSAVFLFHGACWLPLAGSLPRVLGEWFRREAAIVASGRAGRAHCEEWCSGGVV